LIRPRQMRRVRLSKFFFVRVFCITYCGSLQYYRVIGSCLSLNLLARQHCGCGHPATIYVILYPRLLLERGSKRSTASSSLPSPPQQQQSNPFPHTFTGTACGGFSFLLYTLSRTSSKQPSLPRASPRPQRALQFAGALRSSYPPAVHVHMLRAQARLPPPHQKEA